MLNNQEHIINPELLAMTLRKIASDPRSLNKSAFVPGGDPSMGGAPPGADPAMAAAGGASTGVDPSMAAGAVPPPSDPRIDQIIQMVTQLQQQQASGGAGAAGGGSGGGIKPKIDVNVELMQIKNLLAKICDHLGIPVPAQDMVATPDKLNAMAAGGSTATPPADAGGGAIGGIQPMSPMQGAGQPGATKTGSYKANGEPFRTTTELTTNYNRAVAINSIMHRGRR